MKIDDSALIRFINNDLSRSEKNKIQLLINNNPKIKLRLQGLLNFRSMLKEESKANKRMKMPKSLYEKISSEKNIKKSYVSNNFYKIAAGILGFISIGWIITSPNKAYLSQKSYMPNKYHSSKIYYTKSERDEFLLKYDNCKSVKQKTFDENNKEVFPVVCKMD